MKYREPFAPLVPGVEFVRLNDIADLEAKFDDSVCAIVVEAIQGEGGIFPMSGAFWTRARELATHYGAALIADEIQCGLGRTGRAFAYQRHVGLPDIVVVAKPLAGGLPLGAILAQGSFAEAFSPGLARLDLWRRAADLRGGAGIPGNRSKTKTCWRTSAQRGAQLRAGLSRLAAEFDFIREVRGEGLMVGLDLDGRGPDLRANAALQQGLIINCTHDHVIRLLPPFIVTERQVDDFLARLPRRFSRKTKRPARAPPRAFARERGCSSRAHRRPIGSRIMTTIPSTARFCRRSS